MTKPQSLFVAAAANVAVTLLSSPSIAQPMGRGFWSDGPPSMMGPGMMMGPSMMHNWGRGDLRSFCNPGVAGFSEWQYDRIVRRVQPNDAQKKLLDDARTASTKAAAKIAETCPAEFPTSATARLTFMEKRMEGMLEAIRTVRPSFEAFYAALDASQKTKLDGLEARRGWRGLR